MRKEFGSDLYFYGERTGERVVGRHAGIKHITFVNPASGNKVDLGLFIVGFCFVLLCFFVFLFASCCF